MSPEPRYPDRVPRRYVERPRSAATVRADQRRRDSKRSRYSPGPAQSTKSLTVKLTALAVAGTLLISGLIAAQMAAGNDPALGPKALARAKKASTKSSSGSSTSASNGSSGTDPYTQSYGGGGYYGGSSDYSGSTGYSSGSSGSSGYSSGSTGSSYSAPPVTSSTS